MNDLRASRGTVFHAVCRGHPTRRTSAAVALLVGGGKRSVFGNINQHGSYSIRFYTKTKIVTGRWPSGIKEGAEFFMPTMCEQHRRDAHADQVRVEAAITSWSGPLVE